MAFFLIGRGPGDELRLLSSTSFESRQDAMAELSRLSAEPAFDQWDAEVTVMDLSTGAPVLLVRPAAGVPVAVPVAEGDADAWEADLPAEEPVGAEPVEAVELVDTDESLAETPEEIPEAIEAESWEPPAVVLIEPVGDVAIADAIVAEAEPERIAEPEPIAEPAVEPAALAAAEPAADVEAMTGTPLLLTEFSADAEPAVEADAETPAEVPAPFAEAAPEAEPADDNDELRAAILRTTEQMTAEGIVPPESVGFDEPLAEATEAPVAEPAEPNQPAVAFPETEFAEALAASTIEPEVPVAEAEGEASAWPWVEPAENTGAVPAEVAGVYDALEQPADELPEPDLEAVLRQSVFVAPADGVPADDAEAHAPMSAMPVEFVAAEPAVPGDTSDFILDLDSVEHPDMALVADAPSSAEPAPVSEVGAEAAAPSEPAGYEASTSPVDDFTCSDCVYVDTCPNRDQRLPKDCGSFQWR